MSIRRSGTGIWLKFLPIVLIVLGTAVWYGGRPVAQPAGVLVDDEPLQTALAGAPSLRPRGYQLNPVATFEGTVRVLGKKRYRADAHARLAPFDLAVGWGPMSDTAILDQFHIFQTQRLYIWRTERYPIPKEEVIRNSTNIHIIPAGSDVSAVLSRIREGHLIRFSGRLVDVLSTDGGRWRTSRSRTDAGVGACEILWLEEVEIVR
jgi:hypothetical protein